MQLSSFLDYGDSGFLSVDLHGTPEPYYVQSRMERLMEISEQQERGIRLETRQNPNFGWNSIFTTPSLEFVHDRWPRFTKVKSPENKDNVSFSVQYFCERGTIFQRYTWEDGATDDANSELPEFTFDSSLLVRELDFVARKNIFNSDERLHVREAISSQHTLLIIHDNRDDSITGLSVTPFAFREIQTIIPVEGDEYLYRLDLSEAIRSHYRDFGTLEITMAYKLESKTARQRWNDPPVEPSQLESMASTLSGHINVPYQRLVFSSHRHLDFVTRRNLEHILSVCSIPVPERAANGNTHSAIPFPETSRHEEMAVALTCGDISGHRITSSASL